MATATERQAWIPENVGDSLTGTIIEVIRAWSDPRTNGGRDMEHGWYPLIRLKTDNGNVRDWHAFSTVAESRVRDKRPVPGERITITYQGESEKEPSKGMNRPKLFDIVIDGRDPVQEAHDVYDQLYGKGKRPPLVRPDDDVPWTDSDLGPVE